MTPEQARQSIAAMAQDMANRAPLSPVPVYTVRRWGKRILEALAAMERS